MAIEMVNGYACANCSDASLAKKGIDPSKASTVAEGLALEKSEKNANALLPDAIQGAAEAERARPKLDFSQNLDILV